MTDDPHRVQLCASAPTPFDGEDFAHSMKREGIHLWLSSEHVNGSVRLESPCNFAQGFGTVRSLDVGAFSYTWSFISNNVGVIGRYCSIAEQVGFGHMEHPTDWLSTSSFTYEPEVFSDHIARKAGSLYTKAALPVERKREPIEIGHDVWIGHQAYVRSGTRLGTGCVVGARAIVTKDVPPYAVVVGNPARIVKYRFSEEVIARLLRLQWWLYDFTEFSELDARDVHRSCDRLEALIGGGLRPYRPAVVHMRGNGTRDGFRFWVERPD